MLVRPLAEDLTLPEGLLPWARVALCLPMIPLGKASYRPANGVCWTGAARR